MDNDLLRLKLILSPFLQFIGEASSKLSFYEFSDKIFFFIIVSKYFIWLKTCYWEALV
jgi:hypothetical protein